MILLVHMLFGAAIGYTIYSATESAWLALILALLGHYFLDLFPHIEYLESTEDSVKKIKNKSLKEYLPDTIKVLVDFLLGLFLIFLVSTNQTIIYICAILSIAPDGFTVINSLFESNLLKKHQYFHGKLIHFLKYKKTTAPNKLGARPSIKNSIFNTLVSTPFRISTQVTASLISIYLLLL